MSLPQNAKSKPYPKLLQPECSLFVRVRGILLKEEEIFYIYFMIVTYSIIINFTKQSKYVGTMKNILRTSCIFTKYLKQ